MRSTQSSIAKIVRADETTVRVLARKIPSEVGTQWKP